MVLVIYGATTCALCGRVLHHGEDITGFPPFFANQRAPEFVLSDGAAHDASLAAAPFGARALAKLAACKRRVQQPKTCVVCEREITDPQDYFCTGPLSDSPDEPIAAVDWVEAHVGCLAAWRDLPAFVAVVEEVSRSPLWEGDALEYLLDRVAQITGYGRRG